MFDPWLEYVARKLLYEFALHPVPIDAQALDKRVYPGAGFSSSESTNSRAGARPFGNSTYSIVNSPFTLF
ncbi:MAG: hypothetical protein WA175_10625 [Candidatus Acidiferrales bacterium]